LYSYSFAQNGYQTLIDSIDQQKILKGIISEKILRDEPSFTWMKGDLSSYQPDIALVNLLKARKGSIHFLLFAGTWCEDSQTILPRFFKCLHVAGIEENKLSLLGTDRKKKTLGLLSEAFKIDRVPTIIILINGKETGRIIEYGKYGNIEKDLLEILTENK
jgi:hypothetical protein